MSDSSYTPPKVWQWEPGNGGKFASINRPVAGPTHDKELPVGKHPLQLYSLATPNGVKVTILLEELLEAGIKEAEYDAWLINIIEGDQFGSGFVDVNPNSKIPAMMDHSVEPSQRLFESGSILKYLAEKGKCLKYVGFIHARYFPFFALVFAAFSNGEGKIKKPLGNRTCKPQCLARLIFICFWAAVMNSSAVK